VLRVDARLTAAGARASTTFFELVENVLHDRASCDAKSIACTGI
jgi:hypothetical protein